MNHGITPGEGTSKRSLRRYALAERRAQLLRIPVWALPRPRPLPEEKRTVDRGWQDPIPGFSASMRGEPLEYWPPSGTWLAAEGGVR